MASKRIPKLLHHPMAALPTSAMSSLPIGYRPRMNAPAMRPVGEQLREWRLRRRMSQLDLACDAEISTRHLSFVETGRAAPSREMLLRLVERLDVPLRERNAVLLAGGYAPMFKERPLDDPELASARRAIELLLQGHGPFPALAVDRHWQLVMANDAVPLLLEGAAPALLQPPVNVLRLALHPDGLAPRIVNFAEWRGHLLARLHAQVVASADPVLDELMRELCEYPVPHEAASAEAPAGIAGVAVLLRLRTGLGVLTFISTTTVFGTPVDITLSELALETFFPADEATARALRGAATHGSNR
jgi:transcriptional regulator with XRE-family HTH domain